MDIAPATDFAGMKDSARSKPAPRLFVECSLAAGDRVSLDGDRAHYVSRVLRMAVGDALTVFADGDFDYPATITGMGKRRVTLAVGEGEANRRESPLAVRLLQGVARGDRMDFVVQKATELGVREIVPLMTDFSVVRLDAARAARRTQHWRNIARSACEQCGRSRVPVIAEPTRLSACLQVSAAATRLVFTPEVGAKITTLEPERELLEVLIGPEGGLSDGELNDAQAAGFRPVSLGPRVLRTETAAIAALAALQTCWGDA